MLVLLMRNVMNHVPSLPVFLLRHRNSSSKKSLCVLSEIICNGKKLFSCRLQKIET